MLYLQLEQFFFSKKYFISKNSFSFLQDNLTIKKKILIERMYFAYFLKFFKAFFSYFSPIFIDFFNLLKKYIQFNLINVIKK